MGLILSLLGRIPSIWLIVAGAVAIAGFGVWCDHLGHARAEKSFNVERLAWADERTKAATAALAQSEAYRALEAKHDLAIQEIDNRDQTHKAQIQTHDVAASRTIGGLRTSLDTALNTLNRSSSGSIPTPAGCEDTAEAARGAAELARILGEGSQRLAERGRVMAKFADEAEAASIACISADQVNRSR